MGAKGFIISVIFLMMGNISYGMNDDSQSSSPALQSTSKNIEEVCGCLQSLAFFIGCWIQDTSMHAKQALSGSEDNFEITYAPNPSWSTLGQPKESQHSIPFDYSRKNSAQVRAMSVALKKKND